MNFTPFIDKMAVLLNKKFETIKNDGRPKMNPVISSVQVVLKLLKTA